MRVAFANAKVTHIFFCLNISVFTVLNNQRFNDTLTNNIVVLNNWALILKFEQHHSTLLIYLKLGWVTKSADPDQTPRSVGLYCLLMLITLGYRRQSSVCHITLITHMF